MAGGSFLQSGVDSVIRKVAMVSIAPRCCLSCRAGRVRDTHLSGEIIGILKQLKDEMDQSPCTEDGVGSER